MVQFAGGVAVPHVGVVLATPRPSLWQIVVVQVEAALPMSLGVGYPSTPDALPTSILPLLWPAETVVPSTAPIWHLAQSEIPKLKWAEWLPVDGCSSWHRAHFCCEESPHVGVVIICPVVGLA